jgi:UDP-2,3-diacylglucosamine pyrophosphatase LpxH
MLKDGTIVFISDIHMGSEAGVKPTAPLKKWGWLGRDRAEYLGGYLSSLADDPSIHTVVVLGDLFDDWVVPAQLAPGEDSDAPDALLRLIAQAGQNQPIRRGFNRLVAEGKELHYVRGNHDMFLSDQLLREWVPGIICGQDEDGPGTGAYVLDDLIRAEHGCAYCLTNAPYVENDRFRYPVGYYMARIDAYDHAVNGSGANYLEIFLNMLGDFDPDERVGKAVLATAHSAEMAENSLFIMNSDYPRSVTVTEVAEKFMDWYLEWDRRNYPVPAKSALRSEVGLQTTMRQRWLNSGAVKIAICGHTHKTRLTGYPTTNQDKDRPSNYIYANTGAWVDGGYPTSVEVDIRQDQNRAYVRTVRMFKSRAPQVLVERFVHI